MAKRKRIAQLLEEAYESPEVRDTIRKDAELHKTVDRIESGECTLPHEDDAIRFHRKVLGLADVSPEAQVQHDRIASLEKQVADLVTVRDERVASGVKDILAPVRR